MDKKIKGIIVPNLVPLHADGSINEQELNRIVEFLITHGIHGIYPNGSTGEFTRFSFEERKRLVQIITNQSRGRLKVIAGAAEANVKTVLEACQYYASLGCDAAVICPPYYYKLSQDIIETYFAEIADQSPINIMLYNIPMFANPLTVETVKRLARFPRIIGIKDSSGDLVFFSHIMNEIQNLRPDFCFLTGTEELLFPTLMLGADGGTIATAGILPELVMALYTSTLNKDYEQARVLQFGLLRLVAAMKQISFPHGFRAAATLRGFQMGESRQKLSDCEKCQLSQLESEIRELLIPLIPKKERTEFGVSALDNSRRTLLPPCLREAEAPLRHRQVNEEQIRAIVRQVIQQYEKFNR